MVSSGLVASASPAELEGVLAHEVAHVARRDVVVQTVAVLLASTLVELARLGGFLQRALLFVLGPIAAAFVHLLLSPKRELQADRAAAALCESPHGLADVLLRLDLAGELVGLDASPVTEPLHTVNPFPRERPGALFDTHPPVAERVRRLRALDPAWPRDAPRRGLERAPETRRAPRGRSSKVIRRLPTLPGGCPPSTIGAGGLNFSVRNGKRCTPAAMTAEIVRGACVEAVAHPQNSIATTSCSKSRPRAISTGPLHASLRFHGPPINVVVSHGPYSF